MWAGATSRNPRDILSNSRLTFAVYWLPAIAIAVTANFDVGVGWRTIIWTTALGTMGTACIANAVRCGRIHCYIVGPLFLGMAVVTLFYGLGVVSLPGNGWDLIGQTILVGAIVLCCLPEMIFGKYRKGRAKGREPC